jgi:hypothetical protein
LSIAKGGAQRQQPVPTGIVVNNFNFNFNRVVLARERALSERERAPVMQHFRMLTVIHVSALKRESFRSWMDMLGVEPVARLMSSAKPWPG